MADATEESPPTVTLQASDPYALETLHYYIQRCASAPEPDMQQLAILYSTAAQFARWLTPSVTVGEG